MSSKPSAMSCGCYNIFRNALKPLRKLFSRRKNKKSEIMDNKMTDNIKEPDAIPTLSEEIQNTLKVPDNDLVTGNDNYTGYDENASSTFKEECILQLDDSPALDLKVKVWQVPLKEYVFSPIRYWIDYNDLSLDTTKDVTGRIFLIRSEAANVNSTSFDYGLFNDDNIYKPNHYVLENVGSGDFNAVREHCKWIDKKDGLTAFKIKNTPLSSKESEDWKGHIVLNLSRAYYGNLNRLITRTLSEVNTILKCPRIINNDPRLSWPAI